MSNYRRVYVPNACYFFTVVTWQRRPLFNYPANVKLLRDAFVHVRTLRPFALDAIVVLPDHIHCIWNLEGPDSDYSTRWQMIKTRFTRRCTLNKPVWQPRYWEHTLRDDNDLRRHLDYIHYNPVKHRLAKHAADWPLSSFHKYVKKGWYSKDWGASEEIRELDFE